MTREAEFLETTQILGWAQDDNAWGEGLKGEDCRLFVRNDFMSISEWMDYFRGGASARVNSDFACWRTGRPGSASFQWERN